MTCCLRFFFFKQKTAYEMRISDWSSDVCSSDLLPRLVPAFAEGRLHRLSRSGLFGRRRIARRQADRGCALPSRRAVPGGRRPARPSVRPESYLEISNFNTATVYNKGSEVIRMMRTLLGPENFRKGADLYFDRHDGQ